MGSAQDETTQRTQKLLRTFIRKKTERFQRTWLFRTALIGILVVWLLLPFDLFLMPDHLSLLLASRLALTATLCLTMLVARAWHSGRAIAVLTYAGTITSAAIYEVVILETGGAESVHALTPILVLILVSGLMPASTRLHLAIGVSVLLIYAVPIFMLDESLRGPTFLPKLVLTTLAMAALVSSRAVFNRHLEAELRLIFERLAQHKNLERLVESRTKALEATLTNWRSTFNSTRDSIVLLDHSLTILQANAATEAVFGASDGVSSFEGKALPELFRSSGLREEATFAPERLRRGAELVIPSSGHQAPRHVLVSLDAVSALDSETAWVLVGRDLTDVRRAEQAERALREQLIQAQKMESIGRLAGGVAHDFNNILTVILSNAEGLASGSFDESVEKEMLEEILAASTKATDLTRQLLAFTRKHCSEMKPIEIDDLAARVAKMVRRIIGDDIRVVFEAHDAGSVRADPAQLDQILMNLVVNARDAMPRGGTVTIRTGRAVLDDKRAVLLGLPAGEYATVEVIDTGHGFGPEVRDRLFEPFFTTKEVGRGTGLGLATAYAMLKHHRGRIDAESAPGSGATFTIYLPLLDPNARPDPNSRPELEPPPLSLEESVSRAKESLPAMGGGARRVEIEARQPEFPEEASKPRSGRRAALGPTDLTPTV